MANVIKHKRGSGSDPVANDLVVGEVAIRTDVGKLFTKMDNGSVAEIAGGGSDIAINTLSSSSGTGGGSATFNGSAYRFTLSQPPSVSAQQLLVSINGVIQKPVAGTGQPSEGFSVDGTDIILGDAPATGSDFFILTFKSLGVSEPADNSVTSAKIADGAIVNADINASAAIDVSKLSGVLPLSGGTLTDNLRIDKSSTVDGILGTGFTGFFGLRHADHTINSEYMIISNNTDTFISASSGSSVKIRGGGNDQNNELEVSNSGITSNTNVDVTGAITGTGDLTIDTNTLHVDSSNNRVGIGTTSPDASLHIQGGNTSSTPAEVNIWGGTLGRSKFNLVATETGTTTGTFQLTTESTVPSAPELVTVTNAGNVGIGTTSPSQKLTVNAGSTDSAIAIFTGNDLNRGLKVSTATENSQTDMLVELEAHGQHSGAFEGEISLKTGGAHRLRVDKTGNVGIGTSSPSAQFQVNSTNNAASGKEDPSNYALILKNPTDTNAFECALGFSITSTAKMGAAINFIRESSSSRGHLAFHTQNTTSSAPPERLRIDSSGRVGINQSSFATSDTMLSVSELTGHLEVGLISKNDSACVLNFGDPEDYNIGRLKYAHDDNSMRFDVNGSERVRVDSSGNLSIGSTGYGGGGASPILYLRSTSGRQVKIHSTSAGTCGIQLSNSTTGEGEDAGFQLAVLGNGDGFINNPASKAIRFSTSNNERMRLDSNGNLFHGCTSGPSSSDPGTAFKADSNQGRLEIATNTTSQAVLIELKNPNGTVGDIRTSGSGIIINGTSDYRVKENAVAISDGITRLKTLKPYRFNFKADPTKILDGFFAHEVTAVPEAVTGTKDEIATEDDDFRGHKKGDPILQGIDQSKLVPLLVAALQEAIGRIEALEAK